MRTDPEARQRLLAWAGSLLAVGGLYVGGWGLIAVAVGGLLLALACRTASDGWTLFGPFVTVEARRLARADRVQLRRGLLMLVVVFVVFISLDTSGQVNTGNSWERGRSSRHGVRDPMRYELGQLTELACQADTSSLQPLWPLLPRGNRHTRRTGLDSATLRCDTGPAPVAQAEK